jgi:hypothetical protein
MRSWHVVGEILAKREMRWHVATTMFVRFRQSPYRLHLSIVENRRVDGRVRHEHIASLGSVAVPLTVEGRIAFWMRLHQRLDKLSNRIDGETRYKLLDAIHGRVPMVLLDEQHSVKRENADDDEQFWSRLHDMHASNIEDRKGLVAIIERANEADRAGMAAAAENRDAAKDRRERLDKGEDVPGGLTHKKYTREDYEAILTKAGWTRADITYAKGLARLANLAKSGTISIAWGDMERQIIDRGIDCADRARRATVRALLRQFDVPLDDD